MTLKSKTRDEDEGADRGQKKRRSTYAEGFSPIEFKDAVLGPVGTLMGP